MNDGNIRVFKLNCVSCGAVLDISANMERLACGFCGTSQTVERSGGTVSLKGVEAVLQQVQQGTDKTAAELAIARLSKDLDLVQAEIAEFQMAQQNRAAYIVGKYRKSIEDSKSTRLTVAVAGAAINILLFGFFLSSCAALGRGGNIAGSFVSMVTLGLGVAIFLGVLKWANDRCEKFEKLLQGELAAVERESSGKRRMLLRQVDAVKQQIAEKKRIAES